MWFNMREEVLVYVKGRPLVLREDERPFKNMQVSQGHSFSFEFIKGYDKIATNLLYIKICHLPRAG